MGAFHLLFHGRALPGYGVLTSEERDALEKVIAPLAKLPVNRWPEAGAVRLKSAEPLFFVRVDDSLRAIIQPTQNGQPEILDFVRHETLQRFFKEPVHSD